MKKIFILFAIIILWSNSATADPSGGTTLLKSVRMSVISPTPNTAPGAQLTVNLLKSDGSNFSPATTVDKGATVTTDAGGVLSFVLEGSSWGYPDDQPYSPNYLVRVTYGGVVLCIERLEVVYGKQGLYGAYITSAVIQQDQNFKFSQIGILENATTPAVSTNYTYIQGANQDADVTYTLPSAAPSVNGQVLTSTTNGGMSWTTPSTGGGGDGLLIVRTVFDSDYTVQVDDDVIISTTNSVMRTITFPPASSCAGRVIYVISRAGGSTGFIVKTLLLDPIYDRLNRSDAMYGIFGKRGVFVSDGLNWYEVYGDFSPWG